MIELVVAKFVALLNLCANGVGSIALAPIAVLPEIVSAVLVWIVTGIIMLVSFKYTSRQSTIKTVRDRIKAEFLALSLFRDDVIVNLGSQFRIIIGAFRLISLSLLPVAVMMIPVTLALGQLSLWWQARPLRVGEEAVVTVRLAGENNEEPLPDIRLCPNPAVETVLGPVRIRSQRSICWNILAREAGYHELVFNVAGKDVEKTLEVGNRPMRVSVRRPASSWSDMILYPAEPPMIPQSDVKSIEIQYPSRSSWVTGKDYWLISWFIGSTIMALVFRKAFKVNL